MIVVTEWLLPCEQFGCSTGALSLGDGKLVSGVRVTWPQDLRRAPIAARRILFLHAV